MRGTFNAVAPVARGHRDDVMGSMLGTAASVQAFEPAIDVRANEDEVVFLCDVPGTKAEELEVTVENRVLTIKGARKFETKEGEQVMLGRAYGAFTRTFRLPDLVDEERLAADLTDGVLTIRLPKHPKAKPRKITIGTRAG